MNRSCYILLLALAVCIVLAACEPRDEAGTSLSPASPASTQPVSPPPVSPPPPSPATPPASPAASSQSASTAPENPGGTAWHGALTGNERLDANVENVLDQNCDPAASDRENMLAIYNLLMNRFGYRGEHVDLPDGYTEERIYELADDMLQRWRGSCEHFAAVYYVFAQRLGLSVHLVEGPAFFGVGSGYEDDDSGWGMHGWILASIDGRYYHFDPLYDTYLYKDQAFFMKTDSDFESNHRWDRDAYPVS
ncbi:MAG: transglutaminase-like domain-containing protein [Oscillospiraceae bacterium]|nr:transglutaminase-like domain-containing protein [Oscillospiraceae bacterium]